MEEEKELTFKDVINGAVNLALFFVILYALMWIATI